MRKLNGLFHNVFYWEICNTCLLMAVPFVNHIPPVPGLKTSFTGGSMVYKRNRVLCNFYLVYTLLLYGDWGHLTQSKLAL